MNESNLFQTASSVKEISVKTSVLLLTSELLAVGKKSVFSFVNTDEKSSFSRPAIQIGEETISPFSVTIGPTLGLAFRLLLT